MNNDLLFAVTTNNMHAYSFSIYNDGTLIVTKNSISKQFALNSNTVKRLHSQIRKSKDKLKNIPLQLSGCKNGLCTYISEVCFGDKSFCIDNTLNITDDPNENWRLTIAQCLDVLRLLEKWEPLVINDTGIYVLNHSQDIHGQIQTIRKQILNESDEMIKDSFVTFLMTALHWCNYKIYYLTDGKQPVRKDENAYIFYLQQDVLDDRSYAAMPFNDFMHLLMKTKNESKVKYQHARYDWSLDAMRACILKNKTM